MVVSVEHGVNQTTVLTFNSTAPVTPDLMEASVVIFHILKFSFMPCW